MSLRALADRLGPPAVTSFPPQPPAEAVTLAFAFDSGYLEAFKVMVASLVASGSFVDMPVAVYTDDETVAADPVVRACADRVVLAEGPRKETIERLAKNSVQRGKSRSDWNRGTFLKWMIFEEHASEAVLFLDVDMVCLDNLHDILGMHPDRTFVCVNQFKPELRRSTDGEKLPAEQQFQNLLASLEGTVPRTMATRVNSGVMLVRKPALSQSFFEEITAYAGARRTVNEQSHFSNYFQEHPGRIGFLGTAWNFQEIELSDLDWSQQFEILQRIRILHYASKPKPWLRSLNRDNRASVLQWHRYRTFAEGLLRLD